MSKIGHETLLGAQMSTYATLYYISREFNTELVFFHKYISKRKLRKSLTRNVTDYGIKLYTPFNIPNRLINGSIKSNFFYKIFNSQNYFIKYHPRIENGFDKQIQKLKPCKNYDIQSSFGLYKHWAQYSSEIFKIFTFKKNIYDEAIEKLNAIRNCYDSNIELVSVHFRRGDYLILSSLNLSLDYYTKALKFFHDPKYVLIIFSDDIDYCKSIEFLKGEKIHFCEGNPDFVDMCIMSLCDHNIIANSSFSLWGALLNKSKNKMVICPKNYIGPKDKVNQYINSNYYPLDWIALE